MRPYIVGVVALFLAMLAIRMPPLSDSDASAESANVLAEASPHGAMLGQYCLTCHDSVETAAGLALDTFDMTHPERDPEIWEAAVRKVRTGMMPPAGEPRPDRATLDAFAADIESRIDLAAAAAPHTGAPLLHRLNRAEYQNAIRDLLAIDADVAALLPPDNVLDGFDNIADALGVSPALVESYIAAAMKISRQAVGDPATTATQVDYRPERGLSQEEHIEGLPLGTRGGLLVEHYFPLDAEYELRVDAGIGPGLPTREEPPMADVDVTINGESVQAEGYKRFRLRMPAGPARIGVALLDRERFQGVEFIYSPLRTFRTSSVRGLTILGPFDAEGPGDTPSRRSIFICRPATDAEEAPCARRILTSLATRAFRRPVSENDPKIDTLMSFYDAGRAEGDFDAGVQQALARLLVDLEFLFRFEAEPDGLADGEAYRISDVELASRLSFFLWSSIPDEELVAVAAAGGLSDPATLRAQIDRMLADPRSEALVENFAGQWLQLRKLAVVEPETRAWDANLKASFERETEMLFASIVSEDRSVLDLIDADYTFLNERLARHYGIDGIRGSHFRRVPLPADSPRRGVLGQGSVLTVTSVANRTSPVVRGAWILENILGAEVPEPPPGVETDLEASVELPPTLRGRLELHRQDPVCATCHGTMDPVGLSLENFNLIGEWRTTDAGQPVDASGVLVDGTTLDGPASLREALLDRSDSVATAIAEKLMTYALGRTLDAEDMPAVRGVVRAATERDYAFSTLVYGIAESAPFQMRTKAAPAASTEEAALRADGARSGG